MVILAHCALPGLRSGSHLASSEHKAGEFGFGARAGGWTRCLKYQNLYVFDEAMGRARCLPVSIVIWTNIETKTQIY